MPAIELWPGSRAGQETNGKWVTIMETTWGGKVWMTFDPGLGLPASSIMALT